MLNAFLAVQYTIPQEYIPNPRYRCTGHECPWSQYKENIDFGFWEINGHRITSCADCMVLCDDNESCGSVECGPDQDLPDGTKIMGYCAWWRPGVCETAAEFTTNPANYIWTCQKQRKNDFKCSSNEILN